MPYMAVGSRQILYSDSPAPAQSGDTPREVANLTDNDTLEARDVERVSAPEQAPPQSVDHGRVEESERREAAVQSGVGNQVDRQA